MEEKNNKIIRGIRVGDEQILKDFYLKEFPKIKRYIVKNSGNEFDAKDIFQDALVIVYKKIKDDTLDISSSIETYVYGVCKHLWWNKLKRKKKFKPNEVDTLLDKQEEVSLLLDLEQNERVLLVQKNLSKLGQGCKEILMLFFSGYSLREIAIKMRLSEDYTRKRKFMCQKKLTELMEKDPVFKELKESSKR